MRAAGRATPVREIMRESYAVGRALTFFSTAVRTLDLEVYSANLVSHPSERGPYRVPLLATEIGSHIAYSRMRISAIKHPSIRADAART